MCALALSCGVLRGTCYKPTPKFVFVLGRFEPIRYDVEPTYNFWAFKSQKQRVTGHQARTFMFSLRPWRPHQKPKIIQSVHTRAQ